MQLKMFHTAKVIYMCLNANCFYCETIMGVEDMVWRDRWCSDLEDLIPIPFCPSCDEVMWREVEDDGKDE